MSAPFVPRPNPFDVINNLGVMHVARMLGLDVTEPGQARLAFGPCPLCGATKRHTKSNDKRPACGARSDNKGWMCFQCDAKGSPVNLVAAVLTGTLRPLDWSKALEWYRRYVAGDLAATGAPLAAIPHRPESRRLPYLDPFEVLDIWTASVCPLGWMPGFPKERVDSAQKYLSEDRKLDLATLALLTKGLGGARILPPVSYYPHSDWWPSDGADLFVIGSLLFDHTGTHRGLHGRSIVGKYFRFPKDRNRTGLVMANDLGIEFLKKHKNPQDIAHISKVVFTEGLFDTLAASARLLDVDPHAAVLGFVSGSAAIFEMMRWPLSMPVEIWTDDDEPGNRYAQQIREGLPPEVQVTRHIYKGGKK